MTRTQKHTFLSTILLAALVVAGCSKSETAAEPEPVADEPESLDILILGGTGFIGPHMVREAESRGHTVTLFNRGKTAADMFPHIETLIGDRDGQLQALEGRQWDAVIDNSGYIPRHCRDSAELLAPNIDHYLFISTVSVYANFESVDYNEDYELGTMEDETVEEMSGATYGPMKVLCEKAVQAANPGAATIVRPGYIVGPGDSTDRWTYWPVRVAAGGEMAVPGTPDDPVQYIDVRDLAKFVVHLLETRTVGVFNGVGPGVDMTMGEMLRIMKDVSGSDATFTYLEPAALQERFAMFPIWANPAEGPYIGILQVNYDRGIAAGMTHRPTADTVRDTLEWWNGLDEERRNAMRSGLRVLGGPPTAPPPPESLAQQMEAEAALIAELAGESAE